VVAGATCASPPAGATTFLYDNRGNRTKSTTGSTVTTYGYNEENRLKTCKTTATYTYDGDGVRLAAIIAAREGAQGGVS
jgi:YD repeat-containing protein